LLREVRTRGAGVLVVSEDLDELFELNDRLLVLFRGAIAGEFPHGDKRMRLVVIEVGGGFFYLMAAGARAYLAVPIMIRDEVFGVLGGSYFDPHVFTEREVNLLSSLAAQGAVAIENARLYSATQQNLAGAALLNAAARTLHRTLDVKRLLPEAAGTLGQTFGASRVGIVLFQEPGSAGGETIAWGDWAPEAVRALAEPLRRREAPLLIPDTAARADLLRAGHLEPGGGLAGFPVRGRSRVLGGLLLQFATPRALTEADVLQDAIEENCHGDRHTADDDEHLLDVGPRDRLHATEVLVQVVHLKQRGHATPVSSAGPVTGCSTATFTPPVPFGPLSRIRRSGRMPCGRKRMNSTSTMPVRIRRSAGANEGWPANSGR